ncbi:hypothetical protein ACFL6M_06210 [Candidatus Eisenbacteria bacterium]|uniref:Uncharacterized protein n=1 Tax=Eiseniibacteriota bacterium TaxID=2212470 RepID=A0ABV6YLG5_UNCEI
MHRWVVAVLMVLVLPASAYPTTYLVTPDGTGDFPMIQTASNPTRNVDINALNDGIFAGKEIGSVGRFWNLIAMRSQAGDLDKRFLE